MSADVKYLFEGSVNWDTRLETEPQAVQRLRGEEATGFPTRLSPFVSKAIGKWVNVWVSLMNGPANYWCVWMFVWKHMFIMGDCWHQYVKKQDNCFEKSKVYFNIMMHITKKEHVPVLGFWLVVFWQLMSQAVSNATGLIISVLHCTVLAYTFEWQREAEA